MSTLVKSTIRQLVGCLCRNSTGTSIAQVHRKVLNAWILSILYSTAKQQVYNILQKLQRDIEMTVLKNTQTRCRDGSRQARQVILR